MGLYVKTSDPAPSGTPAVTKIVPDQASEIGYTPGTYTVANATTAQEAIDSANLIYPNTTTMVNNQSNIKIGSTIYVTEGQSIYKKIDNGTTLGTHFKKFGGTDLNIRVDGNILKFV